MHDPERSLEAVFGVGAGRALTRKIAAMVELRAQATRTSEDQLLYVNGGLIYGIRNIVYYAQPGDLADVVVDGRAVVEDGQVLGADLAAVTSGVQRAGERVWSRWSSGDWAGRTLEEVAPQTYPDFEG